MVIIDARGGGLYCRAADLADRGGGGGGAVRVGGEAGGEAAVDTAWLKRFHDARLNALVAEAERTTLT